MTIADDYPPDFFAMHEPWRADYDFLAGVLAGSLEFQSVVDLGCGNAYVIDRLERLGKSVFGIDGSQHAKRYHRTIEVRDLREPIVAGDFDLVICTEVAEHLEAKFADVLVANICRAARGQVFFSAAAPGHGGHLHLNEREHGYWLAKFSRCGFTVDYYTTGRVRTLLKAGVVTAWWYAANAFVLRK